MDVAGHPYEPLPGEKICVRGGLTRGLAHLFDTDATQVRSPAVARVLLGTLARILQQMHPTVAFADIYELGVMVCQWTKDNFTDIVKVHDVFATSLTSATAAEARNEYWTKRRLCELTDAALAQGRRLRRTPL